VRRVTWVS